MNYRYKELGFPSGDGKSTIHAEIYEPLSGKPRGIFQICHGMIDCVERYRILADYLTGHGFIVCGGDHLGHGGTVKDPSDYGYFAKKDGLGIVIDDVYRLNRIMKDEYKELPIFLFGHSMGSFLARLYALKYPESISGIIIHGTGGKNPLLSLGKALVGFIKFFRGDRHRSRLVTSLAFGAYNSKFPEEEGVNAWLTRDTAAVAGKAEDPKTNFVFTLSGYKDLFTALGESNSARFYSEYPISLPTLVMSGEDDPVGDYGKGPREVYNRLKKRGVYNLRLKMYDGARHELFNELNRTEVFADIEGWLETLLISGETR